VTIKKYVKPLGTSHEAQGSAEHSLGIISLLKDFHITYKIFMHFMPMTHGNTLFNMYKAIHF
jgi:hypothetical protein